MNSSNSSSEKILTRIVNYYHYVMHEQTDPRTQRWFMVGSPIPLLVILAIYWYFCMWAGPKFMKKRKPFELTNALIVYNILQVLISFYIVREHYLNGWGNHYSLACQPVDYSNDPTALRMASSVWLYFMGKVFELLDTVFFVLRKKSNQVSFLHLYHHSMMPMCGWIGIKYVPGGHGTMLGLVNSFIHIIMYSYYLLACLGPKYQKYLWWKKHLTELQLIQFCIIFVHNLQVFFRKCPFPRLVNGALLVQTMYFFYLFGRFYIRSYQLKLKLLKAENNNVSNGKLKAQ